jgi:hypothetical protein
LGAILDAQREGKNMFQTTESSALADRPQAAAIQFAAENRLRASSYLELHSLRCWYRDGALVLTGCVSRYYLWQMALSLVQELDGVDAIDNQVVVVDAPPARNS